MWEGLVGDRFARTPDGRWLDIATGWHARLVVHHDLRDWDERDRALRRCLLMERPGSGALIDFDRLGPARWFEAFADVPVGHRPLRDCASVINQAFASVDWKAAAGWSCILLRARSPAERDSLRVALARALRARGFVALRPGMPSCPGLARVLAHRHVALVCADDDLGAAPARWIRQLSAVSPRGHLLCRISAGATIGTASLARERPAVHGVDDGRDVGRPVAAARRAGMLIARADFDEADRVLAAERAQCIAMDRTSPAELTLLEAELRFWRARFDEARGLLELQPPSADRTGWLGLLDWASFDLAGLAARHRACRAIARRGDRRAAMWSRLLGRLRTNGGAGRPGRARRGGEMRGSDCPPHGVSLVAELAAVEEGLARGDADAVERWCVRRSAPPADTGLAALVARWVRAQAGSSREVTDARRALVARGALGVMRWGQRRERMRVLHFVPGLLQVVHDAEDESAALSSACSWIRTHAGARGVAVVEGHDGRVVAHDGWPDCRLAPEHVASLCRETPQIETDPGVRSGVVHVAAPVRYAGAIIGHVVGRACGEVGAVEDAVQALAALCGPALRARLDARQIPEDPSALMPELIGRSPAMVAVRESVRQAARTGFSVLIEGESGTGKELVARALHRLSERRARRFTAVNCAALTDELVEAELFGFARGAFTGAVSARSGLFEEAHGGSLFLDEVSELSPRAQAKLLRVLQEREVRRVGENLARAVDVRVIAATNQPLTEAVRLGRFREDLLFRLAVVRIELPPLRDRPEDLPALAAAFWRRALADVGKHVRLTRDAMGALCGHRWPGNVRELQNVMAGLAVRAPARGRLGAKQVKLQLVGAPPAELVGLSLEALRRQCERRAVAGALARNGGRRAAAARELGLSRQGLSKAMRRLGLDVPEDTSGVV